MDQSRCILFGPPCIFGNSLLSPRFKTLWRIDFFFTLMSVLYNDASDGSLTSQECRSFEIDAVTIKKSMTEYHPLINSQTHLLFQHSSLWGENEYGKSGHLAMFTLLKHLMVLLKYSFSGLHFYTLSKTLIACRDMQHRFFFKVETLLNIAFKGVVQYAVLKSSPKPVVTGCVTNEITMNGFYKHKN